MSTQKKIYISLTGKDTEGDALFLRLLKDYQSIVHSCIGPCGFSKLLCRHINPSSPDLTSSSTNIASVLYNTQTLANSSRDGFVKWKLDLISTTLKSGHLEHFYDAGMFLFHLTNEILIRFSDSTDTKLVSSMLKSLQQHLSADCGNTLIVSRVNLTDASFIRRFLYTILNSKCQVAQLGEAEKMSFINLCLKGFVKSFNTERRSNTDAYFSSISFLYNCDFSCGLGDSQLVDGVLFLTEQTHQSAITETDGRLKCVLFDASFSGDFAEVSQSSRGYQLEIETQEISGSKTALLVIGQIIQLCEYLIEKHGVQVVLCQKVCGISRF